MAIVGGAILTKWMANIVSSQLVMEGGKVVQGATAAGSAFMALAPGFSREVNWEYNTSAAALRASFAVPAICFAAVLAYALAFSGKKEEKTESR